MSNTTEKVTKTNRHYGEGSIYQHKDGRWVAKYRDEAMAKPQYLYGSTEAEVRRKLRDWKKQTARGLTACKKVFFRDYADNWFYTFKQHSVENSSFDRYESIYLHHIKPVLGDIQIASIRSEEIQNLLVAYKERFDKDNFIKNLLLDNLLLVDIEEDQFPFVGTVSVCPFRGRYCEESYAQCEDAEKDAVQAEAHDFSHGR